MSNRTGCCEWSHCQPLHPFDACQLLYLTKIADLTRAKFMGDDVQLRL
jgi:hypothetical protein